MLESVAPEVQPDERELIDRILAGDRDAFDRIYERYLPRVWSFVHKRLGNRADTEETVQEVFFHVFSCLASYREESHFSAWVLGIARRTIAGRFKKKRHPTVPLDAEEAVGAASDRLDRLPRRHKAYPLLDKGGKLAGVVAAAEIERSLSAGQRDRRLRDIARPSSVHAHPDHGLDIVLAKLGQLGVSELPVVSRKDPTRLLGVISIRDVARALARAANDGDR